VIAARDELSQNGRTEQSAQLDQHAEKDDEQTGHRELIDLMVSRYERRVAWPLRDKAFNVETYIYENHVDY